MEFKKYVECNTRNIDLAIKLGMGPMQSFFDKERDNLPFFGNQMAPLDGFGNFHHPTFSAAHIPGRWLVALLHAEEVSGITPDPVAIENLKKWAYACMSEANIGFPACRDFEKGEFIKMTDLHNLRETMHAMYALYKYRNEEKAREYALTIIRTLDKYFDFEKGRFDKERYESETGVTITYSCNHPSEGIIFPVNFGRYIGPLVKFWKASGEPEALSQAIKLSEVCFEHILLDDYDYDSVRFGGHTHSTTAMMSSLAQLGDATSSNEILDRVDRFFNCGLKRIALPFGWCIEGDGRHDNLVGEVNNTSDIMETCLILGRHGYDGYYSLAEEILRGHFLPSQLLDPSFIPEYEDESDCSRYRVASRSVGSFGFPTPYGHEDRPGAWISFNWDIVGGSVNGLCEAYKALSFTEGSVLVVPLHFAAERDTHTANDLYADNGIIKIKAKKDFTSVKTRIPRRSRIISSSLPYTVKGEWIYTAPLKKGEELVITLELMSEDVRYNFRGFDIKMRYRGEETIGANNGDRRLCFFETIE